VINYLVDPVRCHCQSDPTRFTMTIFSSITGAISELVSYLTTEDPVSTLVPEMEPDGSLSVSFVELPDAQFGDFIRAYKANQHKIDHEEIRLMGGKSRKLGKIAKNANLHDVEEQLTAMWEKERLRRYSERTMTTLPRTRASPASSKEQRRAS
jgi:hypothetical protein